MKVCALEHLNNNWLQVVYLKPTNNYFAWQIVYAYKNILITHSRHSVHLSAGVLAYCIFSSRIYAANFLHVKLM
jgi:hypothetical protein